MTGPAVSPNSGATVGRRYLFISRLPVLGIVVVAALVTLAVAHIAGRWSREVAEDEQRAIFQRHSRERFELIFRGFERNAAAVHALATFFESSREVTADEFRTFTRPLLENYKSIVEFYWIPRFSAQPGEVSASAGGGLQPYPESCDLTAPSIAAGEPPVYYVAPGPGRLIHHGLEIFCERAFAKAAGRAWRTGSMIVSASVPIAMDQVDDRAFLIFMPVGRDRMSVDNTAGWRMSGFVAGLVSPRRTVETALHTTDPGGVDIWLYDAQADGLGSLLYFHSSRLRETQPETPALRLSAPGLFTKERLRLGDHEWLTFATTSVPGRYDPGDSAWPEFILLVGLLLTTLIGAYLASARSLSMALIRENEVRRKAEQEIKKLAFQDTLTELPNRLYLERRLAELIAGMQGGSQKLALMLLELNRFSEVNRAFGYEAGDRVLRSAAARLMHLDEAAILARFGASIFAVAWLLPSDTSAPADSARQVIARLEEPIEAGDITLIPKINAGLALYPDHASDVALLLRHAEAAKAMSRESASGVVLYETRFDVDPVSIALMAELKQAIGANTLDLVYQPQLDLRTGSICALEVLVRWVHPQRGTIPPDRFIPLAEHAGHITDLTFWILRSVLSQARSWPDFGRELSLSVNVSARDLYHPGFTDFLSERIAAQANSGIKLTLEITEGAILKEPETSIRTLHKLQEIGARISIDDFGTGYSSLSYLTRLPANEVKIDKSFIYGMLVDQRSYSIVRSIIFLAHELSLSVVAEGVEDEKTFAELKQMGCDRIQGYWLSQPLPQKALIQWLERRVDVGAP